MHQLLLDVQGKKALDKCHACIMQNSNYSINACYYYAGLSFI